MDKRSGMPAARPALRGETRIDALGDLLVSIVVPVFNEEDGLEPFVEAVDDAMRRIGCRYEILFINDGSRDRTFERVLAFTMARQNIRLVNLARNFGKEAALTAGIDHASGDVVVPIDVDLQDPPALVATFIEHWRLGYDVVYGVRIDRSQDSASKRYSAGLFYRLFNYLSPIGIPENTGDFRLIDRRVVEALRRLPERNRFMKGLFAWVGFRSIGVPYERPARVVGNTKFNYWRLWNFALDGLASFSTIPLRVWTYVGAGFALLSFAYAAFIIFRVLVLGSDTPGYASLMTVVLFIGGIQLLSLGILGEYIGRLFMEAKGRPIYLVEGVYGGGEEPAPPVVAGPR